MTEPNPATAAAEELQPCPFCAEHQLLQVHQETAGRWFVCCDCGKVVMKPLPLGTLPHFAAQAAEVAKLKAENTRLYDEVCEQIKKVAAMEDRAAAEAARNNAVALLGESEQGQKILQLMGQLAVATRELEALRGALKLAIGRYAGVPWAAIDDEEVAAYCEEAAAIQSAKPETAE